jgi:hypothetical protein
VPLAVIEILSLLASALPGGQQAAVQQQPLARLGIGQAGQLPDGSNDPLAQAADDPGNGRLADAVEGTQQRLRQVVAQPAKRHRHRGGKLQAPVASPRWLPGADLVGDAVDEQVQLFGRQAGHRLGVQQSLQWGGADGEMAARNLLVGAVALKLLIHTKSILNNALSLV